MTPSAPASGTTTSAGTAWDLFLMLMRLFSLRRPMPPNSSCEFPLPNLRAADELGVEPLDATIVEREHVVLVGLLEPELLQLRQLLRHLSRKVARLAPVS